MPESRRSASCNRLARPIISLRISVGLPCTVAQNRRRPMTSSSTGVLAMTVASRGAESITDSSPK